MKLVIRSILVLSLSFLCITKAYALDEYFIDVKENDTVEVKNALTNSNISDYSNILEYSNGVLTIKEGVYINYIHIHKNITLTSNNKKTNINVVSSEDYELVADKLNLETYDSEVPPYNNQYNTPEYTHFGCNKLTIKDSYIKMNSTRGYMDNEIHTNDSDLTIENSTVYGTFINMYEVNTNLTINNSNIYVGIINAQGENQNDNLNIVIKDSTVEFLKYQEMSLLQANNELTIENSIIKNCGLISGRYTTLDNVQIIKGELVEQAISTEILTFKNSNLDINYNILARNLNLINTSLKVVGDENNNFSISSPQGDTIKMPIISVSENIDLKSSSIEVDSTKTKSVNNKVLPPIALGGTITSDDPNFVFIDENKNILKLIEADVTTFGVPVVPGTNSTVFHTLANESDELVYKVRTTNAIKYKLKIVNGTWEDGTNEELEMYLFDGETPNKDTIVTKSNIKGYALSVTKTGDNEYTYEYKELVNPKTGVYALSILYVISFIGLLILKKYKNSISLFKRI